MTFTVENLTLLLQFYLHLKKTKKTRVQAQKWEEINELLSNCCLMFFIYIY